MATVLSPTQTAIQTPYYYHNENAGQDREKMMNGGTGLAMRGIETINGESPRATLEAHDGAGLERKHSERAGISGRKNSLRRAKNSTDMLRARSLQRQQAKQDVAPDGNSGGREGRGRQFTVANVGNNGMIYLRFVVSQKR